MSHQMTYKGYGATVELDADAGVFNGRVSGLRDVLHFSGTSVKELEAAFHETVDDYLDWCEELGHEPERPFSGRILVRMSPELHRAVALRAERDGASINQVVIDATERHLRRSDDGGGRTRTVVLPVRVQSHTPDVVVSSERIIEIVSREPVGQMRRWAQVPIPKQKDAYDYN